MKKRAVQVLSALLTVCLLLTAAPPAGFAEIKWPEFSFAKLLNVFSRAATIVNSGTCGKNLTWTLDDAGTLTISGSGAMTDYNYPSSVPWYSSLSFVKTVVIQSGVTSIGDRAFSNCSGLTSVTIPDSVTSIGGAAFDHCSGLTSVTIPESVTSIGGRAFYECRGLTSVTIGNGVTSIGDSAFYRCSGLTSVTIPESVTSIGYEVFYGCSGLTSITIPASVTSIGNIAFFGCSGLTSITIPASVTSIGSGTFFGCSGLTSIIIPESVTSIESSAFYGCTGLTSIIIPESVTSIESSAFSYCSGLTSVTIGNGVTSIGEGAFSSCRGLVEILVDIGNTIYHSDQNCLIETKTKTLVFGCKNSLIPSDGSVMSIGDSAFWGCSGLTSVTIPASVTSIGNGAFSGCSGLTSVTIPESVTSIGSSAFSYCSGLTSVTIGNGVTSIGDLAFKGCSGLTSVTIPERVTSIGEYAFYDCSGLTSVTIPASVTSIGDFAFYGCSGLTSVTIPASVTSIGYSAFGDCIGLTSVTIQSGVKSIGDYAFYYCSNLTSVTIPNSVTSIGNYAFRGCSGLTSITIPDSVTSIGVYAFYSCRGLTSMTIPESVTSIEGYAFYGCSGLTSVTIPASVTSIGNGAFYCTDLKNIYYSGTEEQWNAITILEGNDSLLNATVHFNFTGGGSNGTGNTQTPPTSGKVRINALGRTGLSGSVNETLLYDTVTGAIKERLDSFRVSPDQGVLKDGGYELSYADAVKNTFTVSAEGFQDYVIPAQVFETMKNALLGCDGTFTAKLEPDKKDGKPYISTVFAKEDGPTSVYKDLKESSMGFHTGETFSVILSAKNAGSNVKYYLYQDAEHFLESDTGVFTETLYDIFSDEGTIYAYVEGANGKSPAVALKLKKILSENDAKLKSMLDSGEIGLLGNISSLVTSGSKFLDKASLDLSVFKVPVDFVFEDNTLKMSIGLSLWNSELSTKGNSATGRKYKNDREYSNFVKDFKDLWSAPSKDLTENYAKAKALQEKYDKNVSKVKSRKKTYDASVLGYAEWEFINGEWYFKEGLLSFTWSYTFSYSQQGFVWVIPEYTYFQAKIELGGSGKWSKAGPSDLYPIQFDLSVSATPQLKVGGGVGVEDLLSAGFWGKASLPTEINFTQKHFTMSAKGEFGYETKFLFIFGTEKTLLEGSVSLIDTYWGNAKKGAAKSGGPGEDPVLQPVDSGDVPLVITDRAYAEHTSGWLGDPSPGIKRAKNALPQAGISFRTLQTGIFEGATPQIVSVGNAMLMVFVQDDPARDPYNRMRLVYSVFDPAENTWSAPRPICDDGKNDVYPVLVSDGENACVVWQKICSDLTEETVTAADICGATEIYSAVYHADTGSFAAAERVTNDAVYNYAQGVGLENGAPVIYYAACTDNNMNSTENTDIYKYTNGTAVKILSGKNYVYSLKVNSTGSECTFLMDADGLTEDNSDVAAYTYKNGALSSVSLEHAVTDAVYVDTDGAENLLLTDGFHIYACDKNEWIPIFEDVASPAAGLQTASVNGETALTWVQTNEDGSADLYYAVYANGGWSKSVKLTEQSALLSAVSITSYNNRLYGAVTQTEVVADENGLLSKGQTDLSAFVFNDFADVSVAILSANEGNFFVGQSCDFDVTVTNKGTVAVEKMAFAVSDTLGTNTTQEIAVNLAPGESKNVTLTYPVPTAYRETELTVFASPVGLTDIDPENNSASVIIGLPDLFFDHTEVQTYADGYLVEGYLYNASDAAAENIKVSLSLNAQDAEKMCIYEEASLAPGECIFVQAAIPDESLTFDENGVAKVFFVAVSDAEDAYPEDNTEQIFISKAEKVSHETHIFDEVESVPATCSQTGTLSLRCIICGETAEKEIPVDPTAHVFKVTVYDPTCTDGGYTAHMCTLCRYGYTDNETDALGHVWGSWIKLNETQHQRVCERDASHVETENHAWDAGVVTRPATVTQEGEMTFTCYGCSAQKTESISKLPEIHTHDAGEWVETEAADCTQAGSREKRCTGCGEVLQTEVIPALGHKEKTLPGVPANCTEAGKTDGVICEQCHAILTAQQEIPALGHEWGSWTKLNETQHQRVCGNDASHVETENHAWDAGIVTRPATVTEAGEKTYTCAVCGETKTEPIAKLPDTTPQYTPGDVNHDGKVTAADARLALRRAVGLESYAEGSAPFLACDIDKNGKITAADARKILRAAVGLEKLN